MFDALRLDAETVERHEEDLRARVRELPDEARKVYFSQYKKLMRDPDTYAVLNWFFLAGLHHMYLGKFMRGALNLAVMVTGLLMLFSPLLVVGIVMIGSVLIVELLSLFRSQTIVAHHNNMIAEELLDTGDWL